MIPFVCMNNYGNFFNLWESQKNDKNWISFETAKEMVFRLCLKYLDNLAILENI